MRKWKIIAGVALAVIVLMFVSAFIAAYLALTEGRDEGVMMERCRVTCSSWEARHLILREPTVDSLEPVIIEARCRCLLVSDWMEVP